VVRAAAAAVVVVVVVFSRHSSDTLIKVEWIEYYFWVKGENLL
jgi:hypothetical protein